MTRRLVLVRSADKRSDGYVRFEGWKPGDQAVAKFYDMELAELFVGAWNASQILEKGRAS